MNNAGTGGGGGLFGDPVRWRRIIDVNLLGVVNGVQTFAPDMIRQETPSAIVNTGSKQGITCPPGDTAYNVSKAGVKVVTEALAHELRNIDGCRVSAHLLIPGFTFTGMTAGPNVAKPAGRLDGGAGGRFHARRDGRRRLLHPLPRQRRAARTGRAADPVGGGRHRREPARRSPAGIRTTRTRSQNSPRLEGSSPATGPPAAGARTFAGRGKSHVLLLGRSAGSDRFCRVALVAEANSSP